MSPAWQADFLPLSHQRRPFEAYMPVQNRLSHLGLHSKTTYLLLFIFSLPLPGSTAGRLVNAPTALLFLFFSVGLLLGDFTCIHSTGHLKRQTSPSHEQPIRELLCFWVSASTANQSTAFLLHGNWSTTAHWL